MKNSKKLFSIACAMLLIFVLCACDTNSTDGYKFASGDVSFTIGDDADAVVSALGEPVSYFESPSCGGGAEPDKTYTYAGFKFDTVNTGGKDNIVKIVILDDSVTTPEGISIGSTRDEVIAAYGDGFTEASNGSLIYSADNCSLMFAIKDATVTVIHYAEN